MCKCYSVRSPLVPDPGTLLLDFTCLSRTEREEMQFWLEMSLLAMRSTADFYINYQLLNVPEIDQLHSSAGVMSRRN